MATALYSPVASLGEDLGLPPTQRVVRSWRECRLLQLVQTYCEHGVTVLVDQFAHLMLGFP